MRLKLLAIFATITLICSIIFSIHYSISIVDQNDLINRYQQTYEQLRLNHQSLSLRLGVLNSLDNYKQIINNRPELLPITKSIDLQ